MGIALVRRAPLRRHAHHAMEFGKEPMTRTIFSASLAAFLLTGCVTTHVGPAAEISDSSLRISCARDTGIAAENFALLTCTFENTGGSWVRLAVDGIELQGDGWTVATPDETEDFLTAYRFKENQERANVNLALVGLSIVGAGVAVASHDAPTAQAGDAAMLGAGAYAAGRELRSDYRAAQYGVPSYGKDHLLGGEFRVPAGLYTRKSVLLEGNGAQGRLGQMRLCLSQPQDRCVDVATR